MLTGHGRAILQFSGGKDSTALIHMARPWLDQIEVVTVDTGADFPHVRDHIHATLDALGVKATFIRSDSMGWTKTHGMPADIIPVEASDVAPHMAGASPRLISYFTCCFENIMRPMHEYVTASGHSLVLRGSKKADARVGVPSGFTFNGIEYRSPLWDWSDGEVFTYLSGNGISIPDQYDHGVNDGLDCWFCPAHLHHSGAKKLEYLKTKYPDLWPDIAANVRTVASVAREEMARLSAVWDVVAEGENNEHF